MKKLNKVRGRITHAKQIKAGMTLYSSGIGGVETLRVLRKPFTECGILSNKRDLNSFWVGVGCKYALNGIRTRSLNDMGVYQQGGYINEYNRLFHTAAQANNWQVYLGVSGLRKQQREGQSRWGSF